jgi:hypothetical protein
MGDLFELEDGSLLEKLLDGRCSKLFRQSYCHDCDYPFQKVVIMTISHEAHWTKS